MRADAENDTIPRQVLAVIVEESRELVQASQAVRESSRSLRAECRALRASCADLQAVRAGTITADSSSGSGPGDRA